MDRLYMYSGRGYMGNLYVALNFDVNLKLLKKEMVLINN